MNNNENLSPSAQLPRTRNANFPINDSNIVNKLYSTRLNGTMSTEDDEQAIVLPMGTSNSSFISSHIGNSEMLFNEQRKQSFPRLKTTTYNNREMHYWHPSQHQHYRRSSIILNERIPSKLARHKSISMELSTDCLGSKLTLDEELYDIIYAFLEVDRENEDDEEAADSSSRRPLTRQHLLNKIREKKEVINKLRCQPWNMNRKRRTLRLAQKYLEQNESKVSKTHLYKEELVKRWRQFLRWLGNIWIYFVPWESRIKRIESQFGSVVSSYFTFLRWVICINFTITVVILAFIVVPECIADAMADPGRRNRTAGRKHLSPEELPHANELAVVWHFDGYLRVSPLFYGFYSNDQFISETIRYPLPLAYFLSTLFVFFFSLIIIPRRIARNARISKLSGTKAEQYVFNWKLFTGWDYSIGSAETAQNTAMAVVIKLREAINECHSYAQKACIPSLWAIRILTNTVIIGMIALSVYCIQAAMRSSETVEKSSGSLFTKNQVPLLMSTITHIFPMIFDLIGRAEKHHARTALRLHLIRISALYIINYVTLMLSLFEKLDNIRDISRTTAATLLEDSAENNDHLTPSEWNSNSRQPQQFYSRNFSSPYQLKQFFMNALGFVTKQHGRREAENGGEEIGKIFVNGTSVTVRAQFGPVGVNNPTILLRNYTQHPLLEPSSFEARRIGPTPLPIFTPPPIPPTMRTPTFKETNFGPIFNENERETSTIPNLSSTVPNITVKRPIDGLPFAKPERIPTLPKAKNGDHLKSSSTDSGNVPLTQSDMFSRTSQRERPNIVEQSATSATTQTVISTSTDWIDEDDTENNMHYNEEICWETMLGQEIVKLITMDLYITIISIFLIDFVRGIWIRYCSSWWCWDIETTFPEYGEFKVAENVLHICNNQGMVWLGLFFTPLLPAINSFKLVIIMYIRGWACTTCNVPAREIFRASRSSSFFLYILLSALLLCTVPVGFVITVKRPSILCGPFAGQEHFYAIVTDLIKGHVNRKVLRWVRYLTSPGVIFPFILLLVLFIFFLFSLVRGLRKANTDLQNQLIHERTEEKRKIFELAGGGTRKKGSSFGASTVRAAAQFLHPQKDGGGNQRKITSGQHLPEVERKRREPWRIFRRDSNNKDNQTTFSFCPSDEPPSSLNSPISIQSHPLEAFTKNQAEITLKEQKRPLKIIPSSKINGKIRPSISSVSENQSIQSSLDTVIQQQSPKKQQTETSMILSNNERIYRGSKDEYNISVGTPETVRMLVAQHQIATTEQEQNTSPFKIKFPTLEGEGQSSIILKEVEKAEEKFKNSEETSLSKLKASKPSKRTKILPTKLNLMQCLMRQSSITSSLDAVIPSKINNEFNNNKEHSVVLSDEISDTYEFINVGIPSEDAPHRISLYSREPRRIGGTQQITEQQKPLPSNEKTNKKQKETKITQKTYPKARTLSIKSQTSSESNVFPIGIKKQFVPSPDEIRKQKNQLLRPTSILPKIKHVERSETKNISSSPSTSLIQTKSLSLKQQPIERKHRGSSPSKMIKSIHSGELPSYQQSRQTSPPCRFRITVSPTRQMTIINQEVEMLEGEQYLPPLESQKSPRRTLIKQQVFTGSTSTFGDPTSSGLGDERSVGSLTAAGRRFNQKQQLSGQTLAPRIEFGEDDSPRVEQQPSSSSFLQSKFAK